MQHEGIHVGAEFGDHERHPLRHQPGDEMDVAAQSVELGDQHGAAVAPRGRQRGGELRPAVERIGPHPRLDLGDRPDHQHAVLCRELGAALTLGIQF